MDTRCIPVEYEYDPEVKNWVFTVPELHIVGGGATREDAERRAIGAIAFTLEYMREQGEQPEPAIPSDSLRRQ